MNKKELEPNGVDDAIKAKDIALYHLSSKGLAVFVNEITSIFKKCSSWFVIIESEIFTGVVIVNSKTGKVVAMVKL